MAVQRTLIGNIKGPKGDKGDTGDTGARGAGATVTIGSVTTTAYGGNANVTNSGTATDAVLDFVLPQGAPGETVTDMENLTLSSMTEPSVQFPIPSIGDAGKVVFGKITKWFSDMTALVATKLNAANVVNNLTTTNSGYALDARQGKVIADALPYAGYCTWSDVNVSSGSWAGNTGATGSGYSPSGNAIVTSYNMALDKAGTYAIIAQAEFALNNTGIRGIRFYKSENSTGEEVIVSAVNSVKTVVHGEAIITSSGSDTVRLGLYQNSGSTLTVSRIKIVAIRISYNQ